MVARFAAFAVAGLLSARAAADARPHLALTLRAGVPSPQLTAPSASRPTFNLLDLIDLTHPIRVGHVALTTPSASLRLDGAVVVDDLPGLTSTLHIHTDARDLAVPLPTVQVSPGFVGGRAWEVRLRLFSAYF